MQRTSWSVTEPGQAPPRKPAAKTEKIPYIPQTRASEKSTDAEKESVRLWNLMRKTLLDNGLMEDKQ
jgi:hypothetical protein